MWSPENCLIGQQGEVFVARFSKFMSWPFWSEILLGTRESTETAQTTTDVGFVWEMED
jgi:hypothetical protein